VSREIKGMSMGHSCFLRTTRDVVAISTRITCLRLSRVVDYLWYIRNMFILGRGPIIIVRCNYAAQRLNL